LFELPPPPPPATTRTLTEVIIDGTVHVLATAAEVSVPVVAAVAKVTTQSPFEATADVTPVALSTVDTQEPVPMLAAFAFIVAKGVEGTETRIAAKATITANSNR
jgi:hypothetical protein